MKLSEPTWLILVTPWVAQLRKSYYNRGGAHLLVNDREMETAMIEKLELEKFTTFDHIAFEFCPGINILIGENGTGKTHLLKLLYAVLDAYRGPDSIDAVATKLVRVFLPKDRNIGRLVRRVGKSSSSKIAVWRNGKPLSIGFSNHAKDKISLEGKWKLDGEEPCVYIPVKEMLANAPGFRSLYDQREIHFEEIYYDILTRAFLPVLRGPLTDDRERLLQMLQKIMKGKVIQKGEQFYLKNSQGELEFTLLAEGIRKFALLWLLIQNGTLLKGATLFWDEPEANINPAMIQTLVEIMLHLQSLGIQIFVATHSYVVLREFDLQAKSEHSLRYFSLELNSDGFVCPVSGDRYTDIVPNRIHDAYTHIYDKEIERSLHPTQKGN